ncbi:hypothetical protein [Priestia koreensis]|uniref:Uncharacterized protein n=1 Tax=Priestia koreensis TaxID=284581 RepID=A0A0M0L9E3_9BACI|nr:hypothetical protein [Priestia koreensis]KOO47462.1 hypothetical protein AMD01_05285 [Priestia koreensis]
MLDIHIYDWAKKRPKKHYMLIHGLRIFEMIFCKKMNNLGFQLEDIDSILVYFLADTRKSVTYDENKSLQEVNVLVPDDYTAFLELNTVEEKYMEFCRVVKKYVLPVLQLYSSLSPDIVAQYVEESLEEIVKENYEKVFLVAKTPKKSPNRKNTAILKGSHRVSGFQLWCEIYNEKGLRIVNQLLVEEVGHEGLYARFLGELKWENNERVIVKSKTSSWFRVIEII